MAARNRRHLMNGPDLKKLRKSLGLSLSQAARQVEVSSRTWARWEVNGIPSGALKLFLLLNTGATDGKPRPTK